MHTLTLTVRRPFPHAIRCVWEFAHSSAVLIITLALSSDSCIRCCAYSIRFLCVCVFVVALHFISCILFSLANVCASVFAGGAGGAPATPHERRMSMADDFGSAAPTPHPEVHEKPSIEDRVLQSNPILEVWHLAGQRVCFASVAYLYE